MSENYEELLTKDPGNPQFLNYARQLVLDKQLTDAVTTLISGLSHNPSYHEARLLLAKVHYELGQMPFALRELNELRVQIPESEAIKRLIQKIDPKGEPAGQSKPEAQAEAASAETVAEAEFDLDDLELLSKDK